MKKKYFILITVLIIIFIGFSQIPENKRIPEPILVNKTIGTVEELEVNIKPQVISKNSIVRKRIAFVYPKVVYIENEKIFINDLKTKKKINYKLKDIGGRIGEFHITKNGIFVNIIRNGVTDIEIWSNYNKNITEKLNFQINGELIVRNDFNKIYLLDIFNNKLTTRSLSNTGLNLLNEFTIEGNIISSDIDLYTIIIKPNTSSYINVYDIVNQKLTRKQEIGNLNFTNILISEKNVIYKNSEINIYSLNDYKTHLKSYDLTKITNDFDLENDKVSLHQNDNYYFIKKINLDTSKTSLIKIDKNSLKYDIVITDEHYSSFFMDNRYIYILDKSSNLKKIKIEN